MSAADQLRAALAAAPAGLRVEPDGWDDLTLWDAENQDWFQAVYPEQVATLRLIGLLLAAAPHLADVLHARDGGDWLTAAMRSALDKAADAIEAAGESR